MIGILTYLLLSLLIKGPLVLAGFAFAGRYMGFGIILLAFAIVIEIGVAKAID